MSIDIARSVAKNTAIQFIQQVMTWVSGFALTIFLPRYLGPESFGRLYLAEMVAGLFVIVVTYDGKFSIAKYVSRSREEAGNILVNSLVLRVGLWVIAFGAMMIFALSVNYPAPVVVMIAIFGAEMLWVSTRAVYCGVFLGFEEMTWTAVSAIAERFFVAAVGITALVLGGREVVIAVVMAAGTLLNYLILARAARVIVPKLPKFEWARTRALLHQGFPFLLWTIFGIVYYRIDTVMLSFFTPEKVVGWYGAAYKLFDVLVFVPSIFSIAILPVLSKLYGKEQMLLARTTQKGLNFILLTGIPISIAFYFFSTDIIGFLFGLEGYGPAAQNLALFASGLLLLYIDMVLATAIIATDGQRALAWVAFFAAALNIVLNYFMIPYTQLHAGNGGIGAALATIITEFGVLVASVLILPRTIFDGSETGVWVKSVVAGAAMLGVLFFLRDIVPGLYWMAEAAVGGVAYLATLLVLRTFTAEEIAFVRESIAPSNIRSFFRNRLRQTT